VNDQSLSEKIKQANVEFHTIMAASYNADQPHYRPENVGRVELIIRDFADKTGGGSLLDIGCGTGFVVGIAKKYFDRVVGIDLTQAMLDQITPAPNVETYIGDCECMQFDDESFDVCTAYSVLHHLPSLEPTLRETHRVLRPGGYFYSNQDPNWHSFSEVEQVAAGQDAASELMKAEIAAIRNVTNICQERYEVDPETVVLAEFQKLANGGIKPNDLVDLLLEIGFETATPHLEWFLGQGHVLHHISFEAAEAIDGYLRAVLPLSRCLYKYFSLIARK
jgi:SAM-dependent methyltransferase